MLSVKKVKSFLILPIAIMFIVLSLFSYKYVKTIFDKLVHPAIEFSPPIYPADHTNGAYGLEFQKPPAILLVIIEGMNVEDAGKVQALVTLKNSPNWIHGQIKGVVPTHSKPNLIAMASGARPEFSNVLTDWTLMQTLPEDVFFITHENSLTSFSFGNSTINKLFLNSLFHIDIKQSEDVSKQKLQNIEYFRTVNTMDFLEEMDSGISVLPIRILEDVIDDYGKNSHQYLNAIQDLDKVITYINSHLPKENEYIVLITSDRGRLHSGGCGGAEDDCVYTPIYATGSKISNNQKMLPNINAENIDLAPSIASLLRINMPKQNQGTAIKNLVVPLSSEMSYAYGLKRNINQKVKLYSSYLKQMFPDEEYDNLDLSDAAYSINISAKNLNEAITSLKQYNDKMETGFNKRVDEYLKKHISKKLWLLIVPFIISILLPIILIKKKWLNLTRNELIFGLLVSIGLSLTFYILFIYFARASYSLSYFQTSFGQSNSNLEKHISGWLMISLCVNFFFYAAFANILRIRKRNYYTIIDGILFVSMVNVILLFIQLGVEYAFIGQFSFGLARYQSLFTKYIVDMLRLAVIGGIAGGLLFIYFVNYYVVSKIRS